MILLESFKLLHKIDLPYVIAFLIASIGDYLLGLLLLVSSLWPWLYMCFFRLLFRDNIFWKSFKLFFNSFQLFST